MKMLKKIYNKLFINYKYISSLFDIQTNLINEQNEQINNIIKHQEILEKKIENINETINHLKNNEIKIDSLLTEFDYVNHELNSLALIKTTNKIKILLVGFYGAYNLGDDLMLKAVLQKLDSKKFDVTIMLCRNNMISIEDFNHVNCIYYPKKGTDFYLLANSFDKLIFGGGAIIDDTKFHLKNAFQYDLGTIFLYLSTEFIVQKKQVYALALSSIPKLTNNEYICKLKNIVESSEYFSVRDENTQSYLSKIFNTNKIKFLPDLVYSLDYSQDISLVKNNKEIKTIGIIWICNCDTKNTLIDLLNKLREYKIHLIPFYNYLNNDINFFNEVIKDKDNIIIENFTNNIYDLYKNYSQCDFIISMRYHGLLLSYIFGKPTLAINYDLHEHYVNKISYLVDVYSQEYVNFTDLSKIDIKVKINNKNIKNNNKVTIDNKKELNEKLELLKKDLLNSKK